VQYYDLKSKISSTLVPWSLYIAYIATMLVQLFVFFCKLFKWNKTNSNEIWLSSSALKIGILNQNFCLLSIQAVSDVGPYPSVEQIGDFCNPNPVKNFHCATRSDPNPVELPKYLIQIGLPDRLKLFQGHFFQWGTVSGIKRPGDARVGCLIVCSPNKF